MNNMRPSNLQTKIFLDSGSISDTKSILDILGFLDGQTTNPSLIAKSPIAQARLEKGEKFSSVEVYEFYKQTIADIRTMMPVGSISIEVYADANTTSEQMIEQGIRMNTWISGAHIKLPTTEEGLKAARYLVNVGVNINMTLVFSQAQAAAVYSATIGAKKGQIFLSPFVGRLDDKGQDGMSLVANILKMYKEQGDGHVEVLVASVRSFEHVVNAISLGSNIITAPMKYLLEWNEAGQPVFDSHSYVSSKLETIAYKDFDLSKKPESFYIQHDLTDNGLSRFAEDWNAIIES